MKQDRYHKTIWGTRATRRIRWYNPKELYEQNGAKFVNVIVVVDTSGKELAFHSVSSQFGFDRNNRLVIPGVTDRQRSKTGLYHISAEVGKLEEAGELLVARLNEHWKGQWWAPAGVVRGSAKQ